MKRLLFTCLLVLAMPLMACAIDVTEEVDHGGNLVITVTISPNEQTYLQNDLLSIKDWIATGLTNNKIAKCKERMVREWDARLRDDPTVTSIPTNETAWLSLVTSRPDYKSRSDREAAEKKTTDLKGR